MKIKLKFYYLYNNNHILYKFQQILCCNFVQIFDDLDVVLFTNFIFIPI